MPGETVQVFIAVSLRGRCIPSTIRPTVDDAWAEVGPGELGQAFKRRDREFPICARCFQDHREMA